MIYSELTNLAHSLLLPLTRLLIAMIIGQLVASLLEALHWTRFISKLASPLVRLGHLRDVAGASFSLSFFSPAAANTLLSESYERNAISKKELILANLFNSSPSFLVHLPSLFTLAYAFLGNAAFIYVGLSFLAASLRTLSTVIVGRLTLPPLDEQCVSCILEEHQNRPWRETLKIALRRFKKRIAKLVYFTVPIYCIIYFVQRAELFDMAEVFLSSHFGFFNILSPEAIGIIILYLAAESGAAMSAAASLNNTGALTPAEIIMALMVGNILSSPMRAFRHQLPVYVGYFKPALALQLIVLNQGARAASLVLVTVAYYILFI